MCRSFHLYFQKICPYGKYSIAQLYFFNEIMVICILPWLQLRAKAHFQGLEECVWSEETGQFTSNILDCVVFHLIYQPMGDNILILYLYNWGDKCHFQPEVPTGHEEKGNLNHIEWIHEITG